MEEASTIILNNIEILLKIAGAYLSELPDTLENNNKIIGLTETICQIDPVKCFEALIIKGKVLHRMGEYNEAIKSLENAILIQADVDS